MSSRYIIEMLVEDEPGVTARVTGLFARRGFNIETITGAKTFQNGKAKIVLTVLGDDHVIGQIGKQVNKLVDVSRVRKLNGEDSLAEELCFVKVKIRDEKDKDDLLKYAAVYDVKVIDLTTRTATMRVLGDSNKVRSFLDLMKPFDVLDVSRTGVTVMKRGPEG